MTDNTLDGIGVRIATHGILTALHRLPERCPYHGTNITRTTQDGILTRTIACCDTGAPALARHDAVTYLSQIVATIDMLADDRNALQKAQAALKDHSHHNTDPCQDLRVTWPCLIAENLYPH